ncbi:PQQ-dependent sugar dehydrogenase [Usitatibacter palustris]|uniref:Aldose sugar dehydrogenase YliI n=1 Tax=Usitatibacter palustris TaxID=2732487 RepID=A0A6M4H5K3_9PROT|nr:PQQ-dependent sugar dehydrogenase [Usitatibacter palustris]QJR14931.1 Aldose sugar dehydrogenase YliI [Usitatibacter palustris]
MRPPFVLASLAVAVAPAFAQAQCANPLEVRPPNAPDQKPAFAQQTRACEAKSDGYTVTVLAKNLVKPWAVEPMPNGELLVTEKAGQLRIVTARGEVKAPISGVPKVDDKGQGGLLDVALSPTFANDRTIYFSFSEPREGGNATSVAKGVLNSERTALEQVKVIFRAMPTYKGDKHYGSRLAFGPDGMLYVTTGERSDTPMRKLAQQKDNHMGKVMRITPEGAPADGNPFTTEAGAMKEVWSLGHRNVQAAAFDAQGKLWVIEHGTQGGDELNLVRKGSNYGWPIQAYGEEYNGRPIEGAVTDRPGYEQPAYYWDPVIAPSGAQFYSGKAFPKWKGNLFIGGLKDKFLVRLVMEGDRVTGEERLFQDRGQRIRDVREGPDGALYVVTDETRGELWKITPKI